MATYSKAGFNTAKYAAARPTYPKQLFDLIFKYHEHGSSNASRSSDTVKQNLKAARWDMAVDLGCGTGQATIELHPFKRIIGVDPSVKMIAGAQGYVASQLTNNLKPTDEWKGAHNTQFEFAQSFAEELKFLQDGSVDLVVSAQAAHWLDWQKLWRELARVLRQNGTVAFWGYSEFRLSRYPSLTPLIHAYSQGSDPVSSLGTHWEQPGRRILDNHLQDIPAASSVVLDAFHSEERLYYVGPHHPSLPSPLPVILKKKVPWEGLEAYLHSFSALHTFHERYPEDLERPDGPITHRFIQRLKEEMCKVDTHNMDLNTKRSGSAATTRQGSDDKDEVEIEWPLALVLVKRV